MEGQTDKKQTDKNIVYLIEELWTDSLENQPSAQKGYEPLAVTFDEKVAKNFCDKGGLRTDKYSSAIDKYNPMARYRYKKIKII